MATHRVEPLPHLVGRGERHATWLELFFDLCFVAAVAALAGELRDEHSVIGLARFAGLFVPLWWAWMGYTWYATAFDTGDVPFRAGLLAGMLGVIVLAAGVPAVADGGSETFVLGYAALFLVLAVLFWRSWRGVREARPLTARYGLGNALGALLWLASLVLEEVARPWVWALAMVVLLITPVLAVRSLAYRALDQAHIRERYGLFTLIVLGESIVVAVTGLETGSSGQAVLVAVTGFVIAVCIWWVYFGRVGVIPDRDRLLPAFLWGYGHLLVFAGIAAAAVGVEFLVEAAASGGDLALADTVPVGAGLGAYLFGMGILHAAVLGLGRVVAIRLSAGTAVVSLGMAGTGLPPLAFVAVTGMLVLAAALVERPWPRRGM